MEMLTVKGCTEAVKGRLIKKNVCFGNAQEKESRCQSIHIKV